LRQERARSTILARSRAHLGAAGESYFEHLRFAAAVGALMVAAGLACLLHALLPALFADKASRTIARLKHVLDNRPAGASALADSDADGLLVLVALSLAAALGPWLMQTHAAVAFALSFVALGLPLAALGASSGEADDADLPPPSAPARPRTAAHVAIGGGGFTGTMAAIHLSRHQDIAVTLIDRGLHGQGLAYATEQANHLLNVRAAKMSAFPDDPGHFARWLAERSLGGPYDFAPRRVYARYLEDQLAEAKARAGDRLHLVSGEARDTTESAAGRSVTLDDGRRIDADAVLLATGNAPPPRLALIDRLPPRLYLRDAWGPDLASGLGDTDTILLVGSGLTMIDSVVALTDAGFGGRIIATSRRGLLPHVHAETAAPRFPREENGEKALSRQLHSVRRRAEAIGWRATIDELRPATHRLWAELSPDARSRFLRHLRPWWDSHRHRIAPAVADRIEVLRAQGRFGVIAGRIVEAEEVGRHARIGLRLRGTGFAENFEVARIVNCTGSESDVRRSADPLLSALLARGEIQADPLGLGIGVDADGRVLGAGGAPTPGLFAAGPLTRSLYWEMTAVPELRGQTASVAERIRAACIVGPS